MWRDPLMGSLFENLVLSESLKARYDRGAESDLYFFRNSKGLKIDIILKTNRTLRLFEVKSGKSLDDEFTRNMRKFRERYTSHVASVEDNYRETGSLFEPREKLFALDF